MHSKVALGSLDANPLLGELERDRDALLASYEVLASEELDELFPEEHHDLYRALRMAVYVHPEGGV